MDYRIREAVVEVCNGYRCWHERRFLAEKLVSVFRVFSFWWPVTNGQWRQDFEGARRDADDDARLWAPIPAPETLIAK